MLELYNRKLVERYMRREFVISRNLMYVTHLFSLALIDTGAGQEFETFVRTRTLVVARGPRTASASAGVHTSRVACMCCVCVVWCGADVCGVGVVPR